jgi:hypothetical protein
VYYWDTTMRKQVLIPEAQMKVYQETNYHQFEPANLKEDKDEVFSGSTEVHIHYFKSDGCVQIVRYIPVINKGDGLWMFGPNPRTSEHTSNMSPLTPSGNLNPPHRSGILKPASYRPKINADDDKASPAVATNESQLSPVQGGRCLDPHPGKFSTRSQRVDQCAVQVWRTFSDGCTHYQLFNSCTGTWDVNSNGTSHLFWTRCIH